MKILLKQIRIADFDNNKLRGYREGEAIVMQRDENSYFMGCSKECAKEFFEKIYADAGPFWKLYRRADFAIKRNVTNYAIYVGCILYFVKNVEDKFINNSGAEKYYEVKNKYLTQRKIWNVRNLLYMLSWPFDEMRKFTNLIKFGFYANEMILNYERLYRNAIEFYGFYSNQDNIYDPVKTAKDAFDRAVEMMEYSIAAFICNKYGIKLRYSKYIAECELERLAMLIETKNINKISDEFGFYSLNPYDISAKRVCDGDFDLSKYRGFSVPEEYSLRWRENAKFIVARYMHVMRICYEMIGKKYNITELIYHLKVRELERINFDNKDEVEQIVAIANARRAKYEIQKGSELSKLIVFKSGKFYELKGEEPAKGKTIEARSISVSERKIVEGPIVNINSIDDYANFSEGSVIYSKTLSPNLVMLYKKAIGVISENGGSLSHAAIIAREMKIPCLIQAKISRKLTDGEIVKLDGFSGKIELVEDRKMIETGTTHNEVRDALKHDVSTEAIDDGNKEKIVINKNPNKDFYVLSKGILQEKHVGNKAANLSKIFRKFNVPDGFVIDSEYFRKLTSFKVIKDIIREIKKTEKGQVDKLGEYYKKLAKEIDRCEFSRKLQIEIARNYDLLGNKLVAARSSSSCEDCKNVSFAGQFDSYLNISDVGSLEFAIKKCWASFYSPRSIIYRKEKKVDDAKAIMAILVQGMINAKYSGIAFSCDAVNNNLLSIEVIPGTCEKLASGEVSPNIYVLERETLSILKVNASYDFDDNLIINLAKEVLRLEQHFNSPQDVEWCIDENNKIWIIQTRPITTACNIK